MMEVREDSVKRAFEHLEALSSLHFHKSPDEQTEAMVTVMESFGMDEETREVLRDHVAEFIPQEGRARGWVLMGFLAGLSAAQNAVDTD